MARVSQILDEKGARSILDLGSGSGRHVMYFARRGFSVWGLDNSPEGLKATEEWLAAEGQKAELVQQSILERLPFDDKTFDAVISVQVIHHGDLATIRAIVKEVGRILKRGGLLFVTVPQMRNQATGFEEIEPNTYLPLDGPEKGLLHHYFTPKALIEIFRGYDIADIHLDSTKHYCLLGWKG
jgi:SAM-dependent methyltransferase